MCTTVYCVKQQLSTNIKNLTVLSRSAIVVIEVFDGVFVMSLCFLEFPVGVRAFVIGLDLFLSLSLELKEVTMIGHLNS